MQVIEHHPWGRIVMDYFGRFDGMELKLLRVQAGLRQYRLAQELGIPPSIVRDYENGRKPVPSRQAQRILEAIDRLSLTGDRAGGPDGRA
jgi:DNA-binding transcriptional regulator YiaG